ncbi:MAG: hypothetical protein ACJAS9_000781 [Polaribacter sp.]
MSILLDSLQQKKDKDGKLVPSVHDSHFDDEMLNDDELIISNRFWKLVSALLFVALFISWSYLYLEHFKNSEYDASLYEKSLKIPLTNTPIPKKLKQNKDQNESNIDNPILPNKINPPENKNDIKTSQYKPKKRDAVEVNSIKFESEKTDSESIESNLKNNGSDTDAIYYEELSTEVLMSLPNLEIDSYAVSSNPKKSFIFLNGSFYGVGEKISPKLKLISINKENALFKYREQLIKKKYK